MKFTSKLSVLLLFLTGTVSADDLTVDPPLIWDSPCAPCAPSRCCGFPLPLKEECYADDVIVDLSNPIYCEGVLSTEEGGTLIGSGIRIQARKIVYTRQMDTEPPVFSVYCEGDLLVDYKQRTLVGETLAFDFLTNTGTLTGGRTALPPWFVGGDTIELCANGDIVIREGYVTTSEGGERSVELRTPLILLSHDKILTAHNITFRIEQVPFFWLPKLHLDLQQATEIPFAVTFGWGGYPGTHIGIRYQFFNWKDLKAYARMDAFFGQGFGGGIETQYCPSDSWAEWYTRNYYASDLAIFDPKRRDRYRFQGTYFNLLMDDTTTVNCIYDFVSDGEMATEYNTQDFALKTAQRTELEIRRQDEFWIARLFAQVKVNSFQSINQKLPEFAWTWHPFEMGETGIITENLFKASYLNYSSSNEISNGPHFHSGRLEVRPSFYRPFYLGSFTMTPELGFIGIAYSNSPDGSPVGQALGDFGLRIETAFSKCYSCLKHVLEPYAHYHALTTPSSSIDNHYIFTLNDSFTTLQLVRFGIRHSLFYRNECFIARPLWIDMWANAFLDVHTIKESVQKGYLDIEWQPFEHLLIGVDSGWNFQERQIDFCNTWADWTVSQNFAISVEYRHRGRFAWRKADFYNFVLEAARPQYILLNSFVSDRRDTFLTQFFYRFNPDWSAKFELRRGWGRLLKNSIIQDPYTEYLIELGTVIFEHWRLGFTYEAREADNRFFFTLKLAPTPPRNCF